MKRRIVRWLSAAVVLAAVVAGAFASDDLLRGGMRFSALFEATVGLYPGSDVRILGVPVGEVVTVRPEGDAVRVTMELDQEQRAAADTAAVIVAPTVVSDRFVQLTKPYTGGRALAPGATITETAVPVEIDELYQSLIDVGKKLGPEGLNRDGALSEFLEVLAANLEGQGANINQLIGDFGDASATLSTVDDDFFRTVANLDALNSVLLEHDAGVASASRRLATVADYLAADRQDLARAVTNLGDALAVLDDFVRDNRGQLRDSVTKLHGPTQVLVNQQRSLEEAIRTIPLALQNYIRTYDPETNTLRVRANFPELPKPDGSGSRGATSADAPPLLLPPVGEEQ